MKSTQEPKKITLEEAIEEVKTAQVPLNLNLSRNSIGEAGARLLAEAIKAAQVPLNLDLSYNRIGEAGTVFIAEAIKVIQVPLTLNLNFNGIGDAGARFLAEAINVAQVLLTLDLSVNKIKYSGAGFLAEAIKVALIPLTLNLNFNRIGEAGARLLAEAIKVAQVPINLHLHNNGIGDVGARFLAEAIKVAKIPLALSLGNNNIGEAGALFLADVQEDNFVLDAGENPSEFLKRIEFSASGRMLEQALACPSVLAKLVQGYIGDDYLAWIEVAAIRAVEGASHDNKYSSINYELLTAAYSVNDDGGEASQSSSNQSSSSSASSNLGQQSSAADYSLLPRKRKQDNNLELVAEQIANASSIEDGGSPSSSSSSSSYSSPSTGGGGRAQLDELGSQQPLAISCLSESQVVNYVQQQITQVNNEKQAASESEALLKKFFTWIKDIPEELQQKILSSFSIQQMLKFLENTINPGKFIEDQLTPQAIEEKFEEEHKLYNNFTGVSQEYAQSNIDAFVSLDGSMSEQLSHGILVDLDPLLKPSFHLDASCL